MSVSGYHIYAKRRLPSKHPAVVDFTCMSVVRVGRLEPRERVRTVISVNEMKYSPMIGKAPF